MINIKNIFFIGNNILYLNEPYKIEFVEFIKPGKGKSFIRTKIRNLLNNKLIDKNFKFINNIKNAFVYKYNYLYLYNDNKIWCFINKEIYNIIFLNKKIISSCIKWICKNNIYKIIFWNNNPIKIILPKFIIIKVIDESNFIKKSSSKNNLKNVTLHNGINLKVPFFINKGDFIKVDPRLGIYISRLNN